MNTYTKNQFENIKKSILKFSEKDLRAWIDNYFLRLIEYIEKN